MLFQLILAINIVCLALSIEYPDDHIYQLYGHTIEDIYFNQSPDRSNYLVKLSSVHYIDYIQLDNALMVQEWKKTDNYWEQEQNIKVDDIEKENPTFIIDEHLGEDRKTILQPTHYNQYLYSTFLNTIENYRYIITIYNQFFKQPDSPDFTAHLYQIGKNKRLKKE